MDNVYPTANKTTDMTISPYNMDDIDLLEFMVVVAILFLICAAISLFGMVGNGIVLWFLSCHIRRNSFTVYILNLAIADFVYLLLFTLVPIVRFFIDEEIDVYSIDYLLCSLVLFSYFISQYLLTAISVERCVSVLFPFWYRCHRPKHQSAIVCAVLWVFSFMTQALEYVFCLEYQICDRFSMFQAVVIFLVFLPLMLLSNMILVFEICRHSRQNHPPRMYILIITTVFAFLLLSLPLPITLILLYFKILVHKFMVIAAVTPTLNSCLNPVIYFLAGRLRSRQRRCSIIAALRKAFADKTDPTPDQP